jgi:hypothetical protein
LRAAVIAPGGGQPLIRTAQGPTADALPLGEALARELLASGAARILETVYGA